MAKKATKKRFRRVPLALSLVVLALACAVFAMTNTVSAQAAVDQDTTVAIGVSSNASTSQASADAASKFSTTDSDATSALTDASSRTGYVVKTIGPTDVGEMEAGIELEGDTIVVTRDEGWQVGLASAYTLACNTGYDATASGIKLTENSMTVAVPADRLDLLGRTVEIYYNGKTVTAKVTDTGGFASLGRALDLAGGVWRAFGASSTDNWGVRTVSYRFL